MIAARSFGMVLALCATLGPSQAEQLTDRYDPLATITGQLDGQPVTFHAAYDREYDRSGFQVMQVFGMPGFAIIAGQASEDGEITRPILSLSIGPVAPGAEEYEITEARLTDDLGRDSPLRASAADGTARIVGLEITASGTVSFDVSLDLVRMRRESGRTFVPVDGAAGMVFEGRFAGQVRATELDRLE